jgi:hypothetical protein
MLTLEYLCMMYYVLRLADAKSFNQVFSFIENFLDVTANEDGVQIKSVGGDTPETMSTSYLNIKALIHSIFNLLLLLLFCIFILFLVHKMFKIKNFDLTTEPSYMMKSLSVFMVATSTVMQMPVLISIFIIIKVIAVGLAGNLFLLMIFSNTILIILFALTLIYSLKFFNLEVPNDEIPWSHNQTSGIYLKVVLKIVLCSQELYR